MTDLISSTNSQNQAVQQSSSLADKGNQQATTRINNTAKEFEALVLAQFLAPLFASVESPSLTGGGGPGEEAFGALLQEEYAKAISARGGFGIADQVKASLIELQAEITTLPKVTE